MTHYYVYYRVEAGRVAALRAQVQALFDSIEKQCGVRGRWLRRRDEPTTYMEIYEAVADAAAFETLLELAAAPLGLERHVERFVCA